MSSLIIDHPKITRKVLKQEEDEPVIDLWIEDKYGLKIFFLFYSKEEFENFKKEVNNA